MNYIFLDNGFEEIEAITVIDLLRRAKIPLLTVSVTNETYVTGAHDISVKTDTLIKNILSEFASKGADMLILPGGATHLEQCEPLCTMLKEQNEENKWIAAICAAPSVLGMLGLLENKQATCYPGFEPALGKNYVGGTLIESQNIITAKGPGLAADFAFAIIKKLTNSETALQVYKTAQYNN